MSDFKKRTVYKFFQDSLHMYIWRSEMCSGWLKIYSGTFRSLFCELFMSLLCGRKKMSRFEMWIFSSIFIQMKKYFRWKSGRIISFFHTLTKADLCGWSKICNQGNMKGKTKMMSFSQMTSRTFELSQSFSLIYLCQVTAIRFLQCLQLMASYVFASSKFSC